MGHGLVSDTHLFSSSELGLGYEWGDGIRLPLVRALRVEKNTPWDAGRPQPPLVEILKSPLLQVPAHGKALVPGCGRVSLPVP